MRKREDFAHGEYVCLHPSMYSTDRIIVVVYIPHHIKRFLRIYPYDHP